jgi:hypothetical protein
MPSTQAVARTLDGPGSRDPRGAHATLAAILGLPVLFAALLAAFAWPVSEIEPRELPIAVVGPADAVAGFEQQMEANAGKNAFAVETVGSRADAVALIEEREAYAAFVLAPEGSEVLVASAASPTVAQLIGQRATEAAPAGSPTPRVTDVVASPADDPRGAVFSSGSLPLVLGGIAAGAALALLAPSSRQRVGATVAVAVLAGVALTGILQSWLGALDGSYLANAGVVALGVAAVSLTVAGLGNLLGPPGVALGALTVLVVGNPLSGITSAPELLPFGWLGQWLPPGALGSALRGTAFFDGAGSAVPLTVLAAWALGGLLLALMPTRRPARPHPVPK